MFTSFDPKSLPKDFMIGCATASYQIEGAAKQDGRSPSIWDEYPKQLGRVFEGHDGSVACDHYNRLEQDLDLIKDLGFESYRFSIAWPRVIPTGYGKANTKGLDFYERLVDGLLERGIKPNATIYHWDLPQCLEDKGGWRNRNIADWFEEYTEAVAKRLGKKLDYIATFNEFLCVIHVSHLFGEHAPGYKSLDKTLAVLHNTLLSHGKSVKVLREYAPNAKIGIVNNVSISDPVDPDNPKDIEAVENAYEFFGRAINDPILLGKYPKKFLNHFSNRMPEIKEGDMDIICQPLDFYGVNYYHNDRVNSEQGSLIHPQAKAHESIEDIKQEGTEDPQFKSWFMGYNAGQSTLKTNMGWGITPWGLRNILNRLHKDYGDKIPEFYVTENGLALDDYVNKNGEVCDPMRVEFIKLHLEQCHLAITEDNIPLKGYYCWSLMDNYEWSYGYDKRFGMVFVDYSTQKRIAKTSAKYVQQLQKDRK